MKLKEIVEAYELLGKANIKTLDDKDGVIIIKGRMAMRPHVESYEALLKDAREKFKPEGLENMQEKTQMWDKLSTEERKSVNEFFKSYQEKIDTVCGPELEKEIECNIEKISLDADMKLLKENGWPVSRLDILAFMLE